MTEHTTNSTTAFVKTTKAFVTGETINIAYPKQAPKRTITYNPITKEQRKELTELVNEWVIHSNLAKNSLKRGVICIYTACTVKLIKSTR
jgi:hypothetical protein